MTEHVYQGKSRGSVVLFVAAVATASASGGCARGVQAVDDAAHGSDTGVHMDAGDVGAFDTGTVDAPRDTSPPHDASRVCGDTSCSGFTHCVSGVCVMYPACAGDGTCPTMGDVCRSHRCLPCDVDIDGDGYPACVDCDETNPAIHPNAPEICNGIDDDCDMMIDEGDPIMLCAMDPMRGMCTMGHCGCPSGTVDVGNPMMPGCTCTVRPAVTTGMTCASAIDLGTISDAATGAMMTAMGNALPDGREVWYHFHATDAPDTMCDHFNVHVRFAAMNGNPNNVYEFEVLRGSCTAMPSCPDCTSTTCVNFTDYRFATDMAATMGMTGQCPCTTTPSMTTNLCSDDSADFYVRVRRHMGSVDACDQYTLIISNGIP